MPAEDHYRVEIWDEYDRHHQATLATASTFPIIIAAWHAAIRTTPGVRLHLRNGDYTTDRITTPGEKKRSSGTVINGKREDFEASVADLRNWHILRALCGSCHRERRFTKAVAVELFGPAAYLVDLERRLKCTGCGKVEVQLQIHNEKR